MCYVLRYVFTFWEMLCFATLQALFSAAFKWAPITRCPRHQKGFLLNPAVYACPLQCVVLIPHYRCCDCCCYFYWLLFTGAKTIVVHTMLLMPGTVSLAGQQHHVARDKGADETHNKLH